MKICISEFVPFAIKKKEFATNETEHREDFAMCGCSDLFPERIHRRLARYLSAVISLSERPISRIRSTGLQSCKAHRFAIWQSRIEIFPLGLIFFLMRRGPLVAQAQALVV
jgi:hypothetical protein